MRIRSIVFSLLIVTTGLAVAACKGDDDTGSGDSNLPACPTGGTSLTYANFGQKFFQDYCVSCHFNGTSVKGASPYDTQADIQSAIESIYEQAADTNANMPPSGTKPTDAERTQLGEWLSCGAE